MSRKIKFQFLIVGLLLFSTSCGRNLTEGGERLPKVNEKELIACLDSLSKQKPDFFYTKIPTKFKDTVRKVNFRASIRMQVDSAFSAIFSYARIPVVNSLISKDTVEITNKRDRCYIQENLDYFRNAFGVDVTYENLEELLLGLPLDYHSEGKYHQINDPTQYIISSHRKWELKRINKGKKKEVSIEYYLQPDLKTLRRLEIESPTDTTTIVVDYRSFQEEKGYNIPNKMDVEIYSPRNHITINLDYDGVEIDEPRDVFIVIPDSYEECQ